MKRLFLITVLILAAGIVLLLPDVSESVIPQHDCTFCHNIHGADAFGALLRDAVVETLCLTCHGPAGTSTLKADVHLNDTPSSYPTFRFTCTDCHGSHNNYTNWLGGTNIKLVLDKISTPNSGIRNSVFESRGSNAGEPTLHSFADNDEDGNGEYDGICETCHTLTKHHRNNSSGGHRHNTGKTCTNCHEHVTNFIP